jgi:hypothetical protein
MKNTEFMNTISRGFHTIGFKFKQHSPEILVIGGVVGVVASAVMACKATTKINPVVEETKVTAEAIRAAAEKGEAQCNLEDGTVGIAPYSEDNAKKDLAVTYAHAGLEIAKIYAPAVVLGVASITCILAGHNILHKRNAALTAAYAILDNDFKGYRSRVIDRFGKELDRELKYNIKAHEIEERVVNEDGSESTVTKTVDNVVTNPNNPSIFARCFAEGTPGWQRNPQDSLIYLRQQQNFLTQQLISKGYLFLNEVYEALGYDITEAGNAVGWVYDPTNVTLENFVDFGIYDSNNERKIAFVNGSERNIWLDFNFDGNVWQLMKERDGARFRRER